MMEIPVINIEQKISNIEELPEESSDEQNSNEETETDETEHSDEAAEEDETVEEEEIDREMTSEEKKAMYEAVKSGDVDALEECLDKPHSDINMIWFKENLLMAAIRHGQEEMAEFLLDNGVDYTYSTAVMALRGTPRGIRIDRYDLTCRQMAYDRGLLNIVQMIDLLEGNVFPFVHLPDRTPRHRRPKPTTFSEEEDGSDDSNDDFGDTVSCADSKESVQSRLRSEEKTQKMTEVDTEAVGSYQEQAETQGLSIQLEKGHHHHTREHDSKKHVNKKQQHWNKNDIPENEIEEGDKSRHIVDMSNADLLYYRLGSNIMKNHSHLSEEGSYCEVSKNTDKLILNKKPGSNDKCVPKATFGQTIIKDTASNDPPVSKSSDVAQPDNRIYSSKSALTLLKVNSCRYLLSDPQANIQSRPLKWRKVTTTGSYTTESRHWHINTTQRQKPSEEVTEIASSPRKHSIRQVLRSSSRPNCLPKRSTSPPASRENDSIKQFSWNKESSTKTATDPSSFIYDHHRPVRTIKRRISPRFMNSYEVLDFIPDIRRQASSASSSS